MALQQGPTSPQRMTLDSPPPLPPGMGARGGNQLETLAGPQETPTGGNTTRMVLERAMLAEQVLGSLAQISPQLAGAVDGIIGQLRQAVAGVIQAQGTPSGAPPQGGMPGM